MMMSDAFRLSVSLLLFATVGVIWLAGLGMGWVTPRAWEDPRS